MTIERMAWAMAGIMQIFALSILCFALLGFRLTWWGIVGGALVAIAMTVGVVRLARQKNREDAGKAGEGVNRGGGERET